MKTDHLPLVIRELQEFRGTLSDIYLEIEDFDSETARNLMRAIKRLDAITELAIFGPGPGHNESRRELPGA